MTVFDTYVVNKEGVREQLADLCHEQWAGWMKYLFSKSIHGSDGSVVIPPELVERWRRQMETPYSQLSEPEQNSDRNEADKFIALLKAKPQHGD